MSFYVSEGLLLHTFIYQKIYFYELYASEDAFFSSPQHKVLKVSYCDNPVSDLCASSIINIYLVHSLEATVLLQSS